MDCQPDIVVAIDLGTTYTGAGWTSRRTPVHVIDQWPGSGGLVEQKVPTVLIHNANNTVSSWGFNCEDDEDSHGSKRRRELFKIFLDNATLEEAQRKGLSNLPSSTAEAEGFVSDYLKQVYACVKDKVESEMGLSPYSSWGHLAVEFLFSVPTTWTNQGIVNSFNRIIYDAGFGREGPRHKALVDLTEAQAAAVATLLYSTINFQAGTVFLTVDGGGGTTDLALMQVTSTDEAFPKLAQLCAVCGVGVGATLIDQAFANLVSRRLSACPDVMQLLPLDYAARFARSHAFKQVKHKFGEQAVMLLPTLRIQMEGVAANFSHPGVGIESGKMVFTRQEIQSLFDQQIVGIMNKIVEQLDWLKANHPSQQVHYMILSGGLGSSAYVRQQLQQRFMSFPHPSAPQVSVLPCKNPQLVVVQGMLLNRKQQMESKTKTPTLATTIARASYGVVVREVYKPEVHYNEDRETDAFDLRTVWATNQIQWLIRKGDKVDPNQPLTKSFEIRLSAGDATRSWNSTIVMSPNEPEFLPRSLKHPGVVTLCDIKSNLTGVEEAKFILKKKRRLCLRPGYKFYVCPFDVKVIVAPADLRFELWFDGEKFAGNHEPIAISWDEKGTKVKTDEKEIRM